MTKLPVRVLFLLWLLPLGGLQAKVQPVPNDALTANERLDKTAAIITQVIQRFHYKKAPLDDAFSERILKRYLDTLDPNHSLFLARDIERFRRWRHHLDDQLRMGRVDAAFEIFRTYRKRVNDRVAYALKLLDKGFDFSKDERFRVDRSESPWPKDRAAMDELWRKRVKNDYLNLRLADKPDAKIRETLRKRYQGLRRRINQFTAEDVFQSFINAYTLSLEPHTGYMSPSLSENFDISMRLSLEGIGAVLRAEDEYTLVQKVIKGGPASASGQLHGGDRIVGVAQGLDGPMEDVVGWRLQDVVDKIRGPKGSVVRLEILPKGETAKRREITLVRNRIKLEEQAAKSYVIDKIPGLGGLKIGVVEVPAFYRDFAAEARGDKAFRSTTRDVRKLLARLHEQGVDGIIVDLRGNGGGSLSEATELTGLFIPQGPVVQVKDAFGKVDVERDPDPAEVYTGPLAVLVDRNSASASEIFAAAIQDYHRGIIIGEPTFGKGTVQTLVDLGRFVLGNDKDLGRLRLTMAQFFRIDGGSTQHRGVVPDILFPTASKSGDHGERALKNALPWSHITPAAYRPEDLHPPLALLRKRSAERIARDQGFKMLMDRQRVLDELDETKEVSLNEAKRRATSKHREKLLKDQRNAFLRSQGIEPLPTDGDRDSDAIDSKREEQEQKAIDRIEIREAARILADEIRFTRAPKDAPRAAEVERIAFPATP